jgi:hypothetical protein
VTRQRQITDTCGNVPAIAVTIDGWKLIVVLESRITSPLAATVVPIQEHETLALRTLVTPARTNLASHARRPKGVGAKGWLDAVDLWWLQQHGLCCVVPAQENMAMTVDAQAAEGLTVGRRSHTARHGQGTTAWTERLETDVVGRASLTMDAPYGTPEHGRQHNRRDFQPNPLHAVVVRQWHGRGDGPGGKTVFLTNAAVQPSLRPFDDDDDRRLIEQGCLKARQQPWRLTPPLQKIARAVRVHVVCTLRMCALAPAYRWPCAQEEAGGELVGWQRWRRRLLEQMRDQVIVCAQDDDGICHMAEYSRRLGVNRKDRPPGLGTRQEVLATSGLTAHR